MFPGSSKFNGAELFLSSVVLAGFAYDCNIDLSLYFPQVSLKIGHKARTLLYLKDMFHVLGCYNKLFQLNSILTRLKNIALPSVLCFVYDYLG